VPFRLINTDPQDANPVKYTFEQRYAATGGADPPYADDQWAAVLKGDRTSLYARDVDYEEGKGPVPIFSVGAADHPLNQTHYQHDPHNLFHVYNLDCERKKKAKEVGPDGVFGSPMPGLMTPFGYVKFATDHFAWHMEQFSAPFINLSVTGSNLWYIIPSLWHADAKAVFALFICEHLGLDTGLAKDEEIAPVLLTLLYAKRLMVPPYYLRGHGIPVWEVYQRPGELLIADGDCWHCGLNMEPSSFNIAVNAMPRSWLTNGGPKRCHELLVWAVRAFLPASMEKLRRCVGAGVPDLLKQVAYLALNHISGEFAAPFFRIMREQLVLLLSHAEDVVLKAGRCDTQPLVDRVNSALAAIRAESSTGTAKQRAAVFAKKLADAFGDIYPESDLPSSFPTDLHPLRQAFLYLMACEALLRYPSVQDGFKNAGLDPAPSFAGLLASDGGSSYNSYKADFDRAIRILAPLDDDLHIPSVPLPVDESSSSST
jgi:hypothetical protein